jgi:hypothetical protein
VFWRCVVICFGGLCYLHLHCVDELGTASLPRRSRIFAAVKTSYLSCSLCVFVLIFFFSHPSLVCYLLPCLILMVFIYYVSVHQTRWGTFNFSTFCLLWMQQMINDSAVAPEVFLVVQGPAFLLSPVFSYLYPSSSSRYLVCFLCVTRLHLIIPA